MKFKTHSYPSQCIRRPVILIIIVARCKKKEFFRRSHVKLQEKPKVCLKCLFKLFTSRNESYITTSIRHGQIKKKQYQKLKRKPSMIIVYAVNIMV